MLINQYLLDMIDNNGHTLISGSTGAGKSVLMHNLIIHSMYYNSSELQFYILDPKRVEFNEYKNTVNCIKHVSNETEIKETLQEIYNLMEYRYKQLEKTGFKKYNGKKILVFFDEIGAYLLNNKEDLQILNKMLMLSRAANIFFILACQDPSRQTIGKLSVNLTDVIALHCNNPIESRLLLQDNTACNLPLYGYGIHKNYLGKQKFKIDLYPENEKIKVINNKQKSLLFK